MRKGEGEWEGKHEVKGRLPQGIFISSQLISSRSLHQHKKEKNIWSSFIEISWVVLYKLKDFDEGKKLSVRRKFSLKINWNTTRHLKGKIPIKIKFICEWNFFFGFNHLMKSSSHRVLVVFLSSQFNWNSKPVVCRNFHFNRIDMKRWMLSVVEAYSSHKILKLLVSIYSKKRTFIQLIGSKEIFSSLWRAERRKKTIEM